MKTKKNIRINKERTVNTYSYLWHTSNCLLKQGSSEEYASNHQFSASLIFRAFTVEAYLNHIGDKVFNCWKDLEYLSVAGKLNVIADHLNVKIDNSKRPWQTFKKLFDYRNSLAHAKTKVLKNTQDIPLHKHTHDDLSTEYIQTKWEEYCTKENAEQAKDDVERIIIILQGAAGLDVNRVFRLGFQVSDSTLIEE